MSNPSLHSTTTSSLNSINDHHIYLKNSSTPSSSFDHLILKSQKTDSNFKKNSNKKPAKSQQIPMHPNSDNRIYLDNDYISQLEQLEKLIWNYKLNDPLFFDANSVNKNKHNGKALLPNEILFKILL